MDDPQSSEETLLKAIRGLHAAERVKLLNELDEGQLLLRLKKRLAEEEQTTGLTEPDDNPEQAFLDQDTEGPGSVIGRYKLLQPIGEGGMGSVWMAEQTEPVQRRVALKLIRPGVASPNVLARFEAERQALALMDHPNIATVFDAGTTSTGRAYFVMELVKGVPITT